MRPLDVLGATPGVARVIPVEPGSSRGTRGQAAPASSAAGSQDFAKALAPEDDNPEGHPVPAQPAAAALETTGEPKRTALALPVPAAAPDDLEAQAASADAPDEPGADVPPADVPARTLEDTPTPEALETDAPSPAQAAVSRRDDLAGTAAAPAAAKAIEPTPDTVLVGSASPRHGIETRPVAPAKSGPDLAASPSRTVTDTTVEATPPQPYAEVATANAGRAETGKSQAGPEGTAASNDTPHASTGRASAPPISTSIPVAPATSPPPVTPMPMAVVEAGSLVQAEAPAGWRLTEASMGMQPRSDVATAAATVPPQVISGQIALGISKADGRSVELRLDPPELGRVQIQLTPTEDGVRAMVIAERHETHELLRRHAEMLNRDLAAAGFSNVSLGFSAGRQPPDGNPRPREFDAGIFGQADGGRSSDAAARPATGPRTGLDVRL